MKGKKDYHTSTRNAHPVYFWSSVGMHMSFRHDGAVACTNWLGILGGWFKGM
jgi:hypothetical protein